MLFALSFSRVLIQTDLYFIRDFPNAVVLLSFFSRVTTFDSVFAFAIIPTCLITVGKYQSRRIRNSLVSLGLYVGLIVAVISFIVSGFLFLLLKMPAKLNLNLVETLTILVIITLTIPFRWLQLSSTSLLHFEKKGFVVLIISGISIFVNFILDFLLVKAFNYIGCILATLLVTMLTSIFFSAYLKVEFFKDKKIRKGVLKKSQKNIYAEFSRIILLNISNSIASGFIFTGSIIRDVTIQFSILFEFNNLLAVIPVATYRSSIVFGKFARKKKVFFIVFAFIFVFIIYGLIRAFNLKIIGFYGLKQAGIFSFFLQICIVSLILDCSTAFLRAEYQLQNKFVKATMIETIINYVVLLPVIWLSLLQKQYKVTVLAFILTSAFMTIFYVLSAKRIDTIGKKGT